MRHCLSPAKSTASPSDWFWETLLFLITSPNMYFHSIFPFPSLSHVFLCVAEFSQGSAITSSCETWNWSVLIKKWLLLRCWLGLETFFITLENIGRELVCVCVCVCFGRVSCFIKEFIAYFSSWNRNWFRQVESEREEEISKDFFFLTAEISTCYPFEFKG